MVDSLCRGKNVVKGCYVVIVVFHTELTWGDIVGEGQTPVAHIMHTFLLLQAGICQVDCKIDSQKRIF